MAKLLKIGSAVTEIEDIKIGTPEEIKEGTAKEAEPVSGEVDNSGNWTSITIGDTTGNIPAGSSGLEGRVTALEEKLDSVTKVETGLVFGENTYFGENVAVDGDLNMNGANINFNGATLGVEEVRVGQYVGEEEPEFKKFGYVDEVEITETIITAAMSTQIVQDKLYLVALNYEELGLPAISGTLLEIYSGSMEGWYKPFFVSYNDDGTVYGVQFLIEANPEGEHIDKLKFSR